MSNLATNSKNTFSIVPANLTEAMNFAELISKSSFCPSSFKDKGGDVLIAMQMGSELGLSPMQAIQNISVINGRPALWGDAALAVVIGSPNYISHREWTEGSIENNNMVAYCAITRKNSEEYIKSFSMDDAKKAGLWDKTGPWKQYPSRMLQLRARAFAIRDKFADALRGINVAEEVQDYNIKKTSNDNNVIDIQPASPQVFLGNEKVERDVEKDKAYCKDTIDACASMVELKDVFNVISREYRHILDYVIELKNNRKTILEQEIQAFSSAME